MSEKACCCDGGTSCDPPQSPTEPRKMKECFGFSFGWFMEDMIGDYAEREKCYNCPDFDACYKMTLVKNLVQTRFEIRHAAQTIGRALGGSHSVYPFG